MPSTPPAASMAARPVSYTHLPLRDCPEDIMPLAEFFREMANRELEREVKGFAASADVYKRQALHTEP